MSDPRPFDLTGPLPQGASALEASAGTGKTFALSALAVRYIAELSLHPSQLLMVSFTEAATAELRGRVRARLVEALRHCESLLYAPEAEAASDPVLQAIAQPGMEHALLAQRVRNLQVAVAEFDAITISTIHGFCQRILISAGDADDLRRITEGTEEIAEVVNDLLIAVAADPARFGFADAEQILQHNLPTRLTDAVALSLAMPDASWFLGDLPTDRKPHPGTLHNHLRTEVMVDLVKRAVAEVVARRRRRAQTTFDGVISATRDLLHTERAPAVIGALRDRYSVVLIDEFQDTDSVQWDIFRTAFVTDSGRGPLPAVTIVGDPKQSIYRFRGAELAAYLAAVSIAGSQVSTLDTNFRSDGDLLGAVENLMDGFTFGDERVRFHPVRTAADLEGTRLLGTDLTPLEVRGVRSSFGGPPSSPEARATIRADLVAVVAEHLSGSMRIRSRTRDRQGQFAERPVRPSDIAILTRSNNDASTLAMALAAAGIPVATASSQSVLQSEAAFQWQVLLEAIRNPGSVGLVRAAALGWFGGMSAAEVDALDEDAVADLQDRWRAWGKLLLEQGLSALVARARHEGVQARLLAGPTGERDLTDLDHVAEVLQNLSGGRPASAGVLLGLLAQAVERSEEDGLAAEFLARRIDRDDQAVTVMTVHKSKGLEFPILLLPFMWTSITRSSSIPHAMRSGTRLLDGTWVPNLDKSKLNETFRKEDRDERVGEARRLLYVALTRARHRCVLWWPEGVGGSALAELLAHRIGSEPASLGDLDVLAKSSGGRISVVPVPGRSRSAAAPVGIGAETSSSAAPLVSRESTRVLDRSWGIWSFTGITSVAASRADGAHEPPKGHRLAERAEVLRGAGTDEAPLAAENDPAPAEIEVADPASELSDLGLLTAPAGTSFGTLVHEVLEHVDFAAEDLLEQLEEQCAHRLRYRPLGITAGALALGLAQAISAPLGGPLGELRLRDLSRRDRLDEVDFSLPLGSVNAADLTGVLADTLDPDDPLLPWAESRSGAGSRSYGFDLDIEGRLIGSIDLTFRARDSAGHMRYWVADYKTNRLPASGAYHGPHLVEAMVHHDYPLQAILYLVALHRYLRWKVADYQPAAHLGGAAYLFLRGMDPARAAASAQGVAWWTPSVAAIEAVDRLLTGAPTAAGGGR